MPARLRLTTHLRPEELLEQFRAAEEVTARSHWQVLWMVCQGFRTEDISDAVNYSPTWIRKLVARYNEGGESAMGDQRRHNAGAAPLLGAKEEKALLEELEQQQPEGDLWSGPQVARWMSERLDRPVSRVRGWETLRRLGYTPQRPRPAHDKADPQAQAAFQAAPAQEACGRAEGAPEGQGGTVGRG